MLFRFSVAVVLTPTIVDASQRIIPISRSQTYLAQSVTVSGWGYTDVLPGVGSISPTYLQFLDKHMIRREDCRVMTGYAIPESAICTNSPRGQGASV